MDEIPKCKERVHVMMVFQVRREGGEKDWVGAPQCQFLENMEQMSYV